MNVLIIIYFGLAALCLLMVIGMIYYVISHIYSYIKDHRKKKDKSLKHYKENHAKELWIFIDEQYKKEYKDKICEFCGMRVNPNASTCPFCKQKI